MGTSIYPAKDFLETVISSRKFDRLKNVHGSLQCKMFWQIKNHRKVSLNCKSVCLAHTSTQVGDFALLNRNLEIYRLLFIFVSNR